MISKNWMYKIGVVVVSARAVFAYLDPGSGSLLIQLLIAVIVGSPGDLSTLEVSSLETFRH